MPDNNPSSAPENPRLKPALKSSSPVKINPIGTPAPLAGHLRFQCPKCKGVVVIEDSEMGQPANCGNCGKAVLVPSTRTSKGSILGDFLIEGEVGEGGMGTVFAAHQISFDRAAALKILHEHFSQDPEYVARFVREARAAAQLNHPNIVQAYAVGEEAGIIFFAMEYAKGSTLKQVLGHSGRLVVEQVLRIAQQIATALDCAWQSKQLVHRDIKPDNIIMTDGGLVKLADLGLARVQKDLLNDKSKAVFGTPQYIAPEQLLNKFTDNRSDIYSLGATLYHAVTGQYPFTGKTPAEIAKKHLLERLAPPINVKPDVRQEVSDLICVMMAKRPGHRYQSAVELLEDIELAKQGKPISRNVMDGFQAAMDIKHIEDELAAELQAEEPREAREQPKKKERKLKFSFHESAAGEQVQEAPKTVVPEPPAPPRKKDIASMKTIAITGVPKAVEPESSKSSGGVEKEPAPAKEPPKPTQEQTITPSSKSDTPKPKLKRSKREVPPIAEKPPVPPQARRKTEGKETPADDKHWLSALIALILVIVANELTATPVWREAISGQKIPTDELMVLALVSVIMGLLLFSRRLPVRILAGVLVFIMAGFCSFVAFHSLIPSSWPVQMPQETLRQFATPPLMLAAALFFLGAFIANTGIRHVAQWVTIVIVVLAGIVLPMVPDSNLAGLGLETSLAIPGVDPKTDFEGWTQLSMTRNLSQWQSGDGLAECTLGSWSLNAFESLDAFLENRRSELEARGFTLPSMFKMPRRDDQVKSVMFGNGHRVEFIAGRTETMYYYIEFQTETTAYARYHNFIRERLEAIP